MGDKFHRGAGRLIVGIISLAIFVMPLPALAQTPAPTKISYHSNKYSPSDDFRLGRQAPQEAERQMPILHVPLATAYVERAGPRLVSALPQDCNHAELRYSFAIANSSEI